MSYCVVKEFGGCACENGECAETRVTPAPLILISLKTQAIVCLFLGFVAMIGSAAWMETKMKVQDQIAQENVYADR